MPTRAHARPTHAHATPREAHACPRDPTQPHAVPDGPTPSFSQTWIHLGPFWDCNISDIRQLRKQEIIFPTKALNPTPTYPKTNFLHSTFQICLDTTVVVINLQTSA